MNPATTLLIALAVLTMAGSAQDPMVPVPELETLKKEYAALVKTANEPYLTAVAELDKKYLAGLERAQAAAQQGGKLDEALALDGEKKAITSSGKVSAEDDAKTPLVLKKMRATYRAGIAKLEPARDLTRAKNSKPLRDDYVEELDALVLRLTKDGKPREAATVRKFRGNLAAAPDTPEGVQQNQPAGTVMSIDLPGKAVMKFCYCPPGSFMMGSPSSEPGRKRDEEYQVMVRFSKGFWLAQTECTQAQWVAVMGSNPSYFKGDDLPVEKVSWEVVQQFITKLNEAKTLPAGWKAALPTEAQWEYACRAGTKTAFSFGKTLTTKQANFDGLPGKITTVASYAANAWGLYDMHGNVCEWCEDWFGKKLPGGTDPTGVPSGMRRVIRGGSWGNGEGNCRAADRLGSRPDAANLCQGFRVALSSVP